MENNCEVKVDKDDSVKKSRPAKKWNRYPNKKPVTNYSRLLKSNAYAEAYIKCGGNVRLAMEQVRDQGITKASTTKALSDAFYQVASSDTFRNRLVHLLEQKGITPQSITDKLWDALDMCNLRYHSDDPVLLSQYIQLFNSVINHLRAILGLDAAKNIHHQVDKRTVSLTGSVDSLHKLAIKAKDQIRRKGEVEGSVEIPAALLTPGDTETVNDYSQATSIPSKILSIS